MNSNFSEQFAPIPIIHISRNGMKQSPAPYEKAESWIRLVTCNGHGYRWLAYLDTTVNLNSFNFIGFYSNYSIRIDCTETRLHISALGCSLSLALPLRCTWKMSLDDFASASHVATSYVSFRFSDASIPLRALAMAVEFTLDAAAISNCVSPAAHCYLFTVATLLCVSHSGVANGKGFRELCCMHRQVPCGFLSVT